MEKFESIEALLAWIVWQALGTTIKNYWWVAAFTFGSLVFYSSADYALEIVMGIHLIDEIRLFFSQCPSDTDDISSQGFTLSGKFHTDNACTDNAEALGEGVELEQTRGIDYV